MEYITTDGTRLEVGRVPREKIDNFIASRPPPEPPTKEVEVFGGDKEAMPILDDPGYLADMQRYYIAFGHDQVNLIADAVRGASDEPLAELEELREIGLGDGDEHTAWLRHIALGRDADLGNVVELVLYQSTVTEQGIAEAARTFAVTWMDKPVLSLGLPGSPGRYGAAFEARKAAQFSQYSWPEFAALPGPEQSAVVAFYRLSTRLEWLANQQR